MNLGGHSAPAPSSMTERPDFDPPDTPEALVQIDDGEGIQTERNTALDALLLPLADTVCIGLHPLVGGGEEALMLGESVRVLGPPSPRSNHAQSRTEATQTNDAEALLAESNGPNLGGLGCYLASTCIAFFVKASERLVCANSMNSSQSL
jgi:hypothetical protein